MTSLWILAFLIGVSTALDCTQIPNNEIIPNHFSVLPTGSNSTVQIPPNWNCTYRITVPPMVYAHVSLANQLKGYNDVIYVRDGQGSYTLVSSRSAPAVYFYIFPNTTTTFQVLTKSVDMMSAFRILVYYQSMLNANVTQLDNFTLKYFALNNLQVNSYKTPQTVQANKNISLSIARSGYSADVFDNYFVIDGDFQNQKYVYRMSQLLYQNYISTTNKLTVVGLDNSASESSVVFNFLSQAQQFDSLTSFGVYFQQNQLDIDSTGGKLKKTAVNIVSMGDSVTILGVYLGSTCSLRAVEAPPSSSSQVLLDLSNVTDFPRNITRKAFSIIANNCATSSIRMISA